jgi:hypothetical protein
VRFEGLPAAEAPAASDAAVADLFGGERLVGTLRGARGETLEVALAGGLSVFAELDRLEALRWPARLAGAPGVEPAAEGDRLYRARSGGVERIDGAVEEFTAAGVRFHGALVGTLEIPWREVGALFVEHLESSAGARKPAGVPVVVDLDDGSRLAGGLTRLTGAEVRLERGGSSLALPVARVLLLSVDDGSTAFLSALAPSASEPSRPFGDDLGMVWPHRADHSASGAPLRAQGRTFPRGIGVHAPSRLVWKLDGRARALRGAVAVDDEVLRLPARGSVIFRVRVDGKEVFASPLVRGGDAPVPFAVDLRGAREVSLEAHPTPDGFAGDRADWLGLVLELDQAAGGGASRR